MNKFILLFILSISFAAVRAQKKTFDLATYIAPKGWKKQTTVSALQFTKENVTKGAYCTIILYKAIPGKTDPKENFTCQLLSTVSLPDDFTSANLALPTIPLMTSNFQL